MECIEFTFLYSENREGGLVGVNLISFVVYRIRTAKNKILQKLDSPGNAVVY